MSQRFLHRRAANSLFHRRLGENRDAFVGPARNLLVGEPFRQYDVCQFMRQCGRQPVFGVGTQIDAAFHHFPLLMLIVAHPDEFRLSGPSSRT